MIVTCPNVILSTINFIWTSLVLSPGLSHEKPATNLLDNGMAQYNLLWVTETSSGVARFLGARSE
jgi:hypothetical protein